MHVSGQTHNTTTNLLSVLTVAQGAIPCSEATVYMERKTDSNGLQAYGEAVNFLHLSPEGMMSIIDALRRNGFRQGKGEKCLCSISQETDPLNLYTRLKSFFFSEHGGKERERMEYAHTPGKIMYLQTFASFKYSQKHRGHNWRMPLIIWKKCSTVPTGEVARKRRNLFHRGMKELISL